MKPPWMCTMCFFRSFTEIKSFGDLSLVHDKTNDRYFLLGGQGHKGDEFIVFDKTPTPDPYPQLMDDDIYETYEPTAQQERESYEWWNYVESLDWKFSAPAGWWFYNLMCKQGYGKNPTKEHNMFDAWVYNFLGKIISEYLTRNKVVV